MVILRFWSAASIGSAPTSAAVGGLRELYILRHSRHSLPVVGLESSTR